MKYNDRIRERREQLGMTMQDLADKLGYKSRSTIAKIESGENDINQTKLKAIASALNTTSAALMGLEDKEPSRPIRVKVYASVPAGTPIEALEDSIIDIEELDPSQFNPPHDYIGLLVKGDSMYPRFMDGDVIIVKIQPDCESGQDAVVYVNGYDATLKTVYKHPDCIELRPVNPSYPPRKYGPEDEPLQILGIVKELRRKF